MSYASLGLSQSCCRLPKVQCVKEIEAVFITVEAVMNPTEGHCVRLLLPPLRGRDLRSEMSVSGGETQKGPGCSLLLAASAAPRQTSVITTVTTGDLTTARVRHGDISLLSGPALRDECEL
ncbi:unnamed protein product [Boreogadus saida]